MLAAAGQTTAEMVGLRLAEIGDQIDAKYGDELGEIIQLEGGNEQAFHSFTSVVSNVFEWDGQGIRKHFSNNLSH